jgi:hypothetical protein
VCSSHRHAKQCIGAQAPLFGVPSSDQLGVEAFLIAASKPLSASAIAPLTFATAFFTPLPVTRLVAVTQFHRFTRTRGGTTGHGGAAKRAASQDHFSFERGITAGVENFTGVDAGDLGTHGQSSSRE